MFWVFHNLFACDKPTDKLFIIIMIIFFKPERDSEVMMMFKYLRQVIN